MNAPHPPYVLSERLDSFEALGPYERGRILRMMVEVLATANACYMRRVHVPLLYQSGIRYVDSHDEWRDIPAVMLRRGGDCKDLVAWRVAELRHNGFRALPRILMFEGDAGEYIYHVLVQHADGSIEDPSKKLGMKGEA